MPATAMEILFITVYHFLLITKMLNMCITAKAMMRELLLTVNDLKKVRYLVKTRRKFFYQRSVA